MPSLQARVLGGHPVTKDEALWLYAQPLDELCAAADAIRRHFCGTGFDLCTIINAKNGHCPENCRFCAQSVHHCTGIDPYPLLLADTEQPRFETLGWHGNSKRAASGNFSVIVLPMR